MSELKRKINVPAGSIVSVSDYEAFIHTAYELLSGQALYFAPDEDINCMELAHLVPEVPETVIAIYLGINDAVCNKGLVCPVLVRHGHNNVFVFDPQVYAGGDDVPAGTVDAKCILRGFEPPNPTWPSDWTYVMIADPTRRPADLWAEKGYIEMIPAKLEDFTMLSRVDESKVCTFIDPRAFEHPVNQARDYLAAARKRGKKMVDQFTIPAGLEGEFDGLVPVVLDKGEKLYVATKDFSPCEHGWSNIHPDNQHWAVVNENSAVPLDLVIAKPPIDTKYAGQLAPPKGSADMTTDWFHRGQKIMRKPLLAGLFKG